MAAGLLLVVVVAAVVVGIVRATRDPGVQERSGGWLRRLLQYGSLLAALFSAAGGASRVVTAALPARERIAGPASEDLALGLSLTLVAVPVWILLWRVVQRRLIRDAEERAAVAWSLDLAVAATVPLVIAYTNLVEVGSRVVGAADFDSRAPAAAVVWAGAWGLHAWLLRHGTVAPIGRLRDLAVLAGSAVGLVALVIGAGGVLRYGLAEVYHGVTGPALVDAPGPVAVRRSLVVVALAAAVWWWHWLHQALRAPRSNAWYAYVLLVPVLGGVVTVLTSASVALHAVLQWVIAEPDATRAAVHFAGLPGALAATLVGCWAWSYHRAVLDEDGRRTRREADRAYEYLVSAGALIAAAVGASVAITAAIQAVTPTPLAAAGPGARDTVAVALTLLAVGAPLWWVFWRRVQSRVGAADHVELGSPSRRAYLFVLFGVTGLTAAISLVVALFVVLRDLLEGSLAATTVYDLRVAVALIVTAGGVSAYHWTVHREDRALGPAAPERRRNVLLVSADGRDLADRVAQRTGATVRMLHRIDVAARDVDADAVAAAVLASPHARLLVTVDGDGAVTTIPYEGG